MQGTEAKDWVDDDLTLQDLAPFMISSEANNKNEEKSSVNRIFLGSFFKWNSIENKNIAEKHGFVSGEQYRKTGQWTFADLDCDFISLHHFPMFYKFGTFRAMDNLSVQIRYGDVTREEALQILSNQVFKLPLKDIQTFCNFVGEPTSWFWKELEKFRNLEIWKQDDGIWKIPNFILPDFDFAELNTYANN